MAAVHRARPHRGRPARCVPGVAARVGRGADDVRQLDGLRGGQLVVEAPPDVRVLGRLSAPIWVGLVAGRDRADVVWGQLPAVEDEQPARVGVRGGDDRGDPGGPGGDGNVTGGG